MIVVTVLATDCMQVKLAVYLMNMVQPVRCLLLVYDVQNRYTQILEKMYSLGIPTQSATAYIHLLSLSANAYKLAACETLKQARTCPG